MRRLKIEMDSGIKQRYHDGILAKARERYGIRPDQIRMLDGYESFIFEYRQDHEARILRLGHSVRRTADLIRGEADWINYLADHGVSVARALPSKQGNLVETIHDDHGGFFLATAFARAPGRPPSRARIWNDRLFENWGRLIGKMHALTRHYEPADAAWKRPMWNDPVNLYVEQILSPPETAILSRYRAVVNYLAALPSDPDSFGLIHQDAHGGNIFVDEDYRITLFDFDDCVYMWFVQDIAMVLFYAVMGATDGRAFADNFGRAFMRGYRRENQLAAGWLAEIPAFMKLREIELYAHICRDFDLENLDDAWVANFMKDRKKHIESGRPCLDFDFTTL